MTAWLIIFLLRNPFNKYQLHFYLLNYISLLYRGDDSCKKMEGAHIIDVNELVVSMTRKVELDNSSFGGVIPENKAELPLIYRIKRQLCDESEDVYNPNVLPIGPYHHNTVAKLDIKQMKWMSLCYS